jgi:hypothetical protein
LRALERDLRGISSICLKGVAAQPPTALKACLCLKQPPVHLICNCQQQMSPFFIDMWLLVRIDRWGGATNPTAWHGVAVVARGRLYHMLCKHGAQACAAVRTLCALLFSLCFKPVMHMLVE